ncbi:receptor-binding cancer antigen expressed on SiSo cells-like [Ptychodera flava]|uniref:receptor-binding cancer antigen expressed on SiSo cells-like n=1 Tax=Ptychodera flava TaxID=63121 RepID=UPI00396A5EDB
MWKICRVGSFRFTSNCCIGEAIRLAIQTFISIRSDTLPSPSAIMKVFHFNPLRICNIFTFIMGLFKRAMCFIKQRRNSDSLPVSMNSIQMPLTSDSSKQDVPGNEPAELQDWDDWGSGGGPTSIRVDPGHHSGHHPGHHHANHQQTAEEEPEIDFFTDMAPRIKKPVMIRKKVETTDNTAPGMSNRLAMDSEIITPASGELGTWDESEANAWEDETINSVSTWEVEQAIKEKRNQERERRALEQQRKKMEREAQRMMKKESGKLAMKLS